MKAEDTVMDAKDLETYLYCSKHQVALYTAKAQAEITWDQATREALIGVSRKVLRLDGTTYLVPDYSKFREAVKELGVK